MRQFLQTLVFAGFLLCLASTAQAQESYNIYLKSGILAESELAAPAEASPSQFAQSQFQGHYYLVLQFQELPNQQLRAQLSSQGIILLDYLPNYAFLAQIPINFAWGQLSAFGVKGMAGLEAKHKLSKELAIGQIPDHAILANNQIELLALAYQGIGDPALASHLSQQGIESRENPAGNGRILQINLNELYTLASTSPIMYLEPVEAPPVPDGLRGRTSHRVNSLSTRPGTGYDGTGVVVAIADDGGIDHIDFTGRLTDHNAGQGGTHGDMTAGIAVGSGNLDPTMVGMATGAYLHMYGINGYPHITNAISNKNTLGTRITSTSYSQGCGGVYDNSSQNLDADVFLHNDLLHIFSAGNSASSSCSQVYGSLVAPDGFRYGNITGGRKAAKSSIATANMYYDDSRASSSSRGPCEDGRLKPDISAHGQGQLSTDPNNGYSPGGGTSAAAPGIGGVSAMLYQAYKDHNAGNNPRSSVIKGILLNTADDLGRPGPDYDFGWGRVNGRRALEVIENNQIITDTLNHGSSHSHNITVPSGVKEVKVMVYWLDPAGSPLAAKALVNDLNIKLTTPSASSYNPWVLSIAANIDSLQRNALRSRDSLNNMEQVTLDNPAAGTYSVQVSGYNIPSGPQRYHVIYSFVMDEITVTYPMGGESFVPGENEVIRWDAPDGNAGTFTLQYSINGGTNWNTITTRSGGLRFYDWTVPAAITGNALIRISQGTKSGQSAQAFNILGLPQLSNIVPTGQNSVFIGFNKIPGANVYDLYRLGAKYMDSTATTADSFFHVNGLIPGNTYWFALRARDSMGIVGRRANAFAYTHDPNNSCGTCQSPVSTFPYNESFETGLGQWCQFAFDDIDWVRQTGPTGSGGTGPSAADDGQYYLYVEASSPNYPSKTAAIVSPCFDMTALSNAFLSFSYHMNGSAMGTLNLQVSPDSGLNWITLWSRTGTQGNFWRRDSVDLQSYSGSSVLFRFWGITGSDYTSDMSVDDIQIQGVVDPCIQFRVTPTIRPITCNGLSNGSISLSPSGGNGSYTYSWSNGNNGSNSNSLGAGSYVITISDGNGCTVTDTFQIDEPDEITFNPTIIDIACHGDQNASIDPGASGGTGNLSYLWSNGANSPTLNNLGPGVYQVLVSDKNACFNNQFFQIIDPPLLSLGVMATDILCFGDNNGQAIVTAAGGTGTYSYQWSGGATTANVNTLSPGWHQVTVLDSNQCQAVDSVQIQEPTELMLSTSSVDASCFGEADGQMAVVANGGVPSYSYAWSNGVTTAQAIQVSPGTYQLSVTDNNGCKKTDSVSVGSPPEIILAFVVTDPSSPGAMDGSINMNISGGTAPYTAIQWSHGSNNQNPSGMGAGSYTVTVTDAKGCQQIDTVVLSTSTGINDLKAVEDLEIYPVPSSDRIYLEYSLSKEARTQVQILDLNGKVVLEQLVPGQPGKHKAELDIHKLASGSYLLRLSNKLGSQGIKLVKTN